MDKEIGKEKFLEEINKIIDNDKTILVKILEDTPDNPLFASHHYIKASKVIKSIVDSIEVMNSANIAGNVFDQMGFYKTSNGEVYFKLKDSKDTPKSIKDHSYFG